MNRYTVYIRYPTVKGSFEQTHNTEKHILLPFEDSRLDMKEVQFDISGNLICNSYKELIKPFAGDGVEYTA